MIKGIVPGVVSLKTDPGYESIVIERVLSSVPIVVCRFECPRLASGFGHSLLPTSASSSRRPARGGRFAA